MENKKTYTAPELEITVFENVDMADSGTPTVELR